MSEATAPPFNPLAPAVRADPFAAYRLLHRQSPVQWNASAGIWFLARYDDCVAMLRDPRFSAEQGQAVRQTGTPQPRTMLTADPPEHARLRRPVVRALSPDLVAGVRERLRIFLEVLLDRMETSGATDLVGAVTVPATLYALADLIGLPAAATDRFRDATLASVAILDPFARPPAYEAASAASDRLTGLFSEMLATAPAATDSDFLHAVQTAAGTTMDRDEVVAAATLVVVGGYAPLQSFTTLAVRNLLRNRPAWDRVAASPGDTAAAVRELLRYDPPIPFAARVATEEAEIAGHVIATGQPVVALLAAANRDSAAYSDPDRLDLDRNGRPNVAFGAGPHACPGAPLVQAVATEVLGGLTRRFPDLCVAGDDDQWDPSVVPRRLSTLPVRTAT